MSRDDCIGDVFVQRCENPDCEAVHLLIGEAGEPCFAKSVLTPADARQLAVLLCRLADEIERGGTGSRLN